MAQTSSLLSKAAQRYAGSLFDLARADGQVDAVEKELIAFSELLKQNNDLERLITSPVFSVQDQLKAIEAVAETLGLTGKSAKGLVGNFLKVVASNRRLFTLPNIIEEFKSLASRARGELTVKIISATKLPESQEKQLVAVLKNAAGKKIQLNMIIDPTILGGLIVRLGSRQIDASLATKLSSLKLALKEVG